MLIKLTNATENLRGAPILINTDMILSIYRDVKVVDEAVIDEVTYIFCPPHGTWEVSETPDEISQIIDGKKPKLKVSTGKTNGK